MFILVWNSPYILSIEWLEESMKLKRPAPEERFLFEMKGGVLKKNIETPASPLSKKVQLTLMCILFAMLHTFCNCFLQKKKIENFNLISFKNIILKLNFVYLNNNVKN